MKTKQVITLLKKKENAFLKINSFSKLPGIYAIFYIGNDFPILGNSVSKHQIIYIGKTESSQESRDAKTHFATGKTGSSTLRKSIGSILFEQEDLKPIPRNETDYKINRVSHFKFDNQSEIKITDWMEKNLALSFYEYPKTKKEIEDLEIEIINELVPILNISKNPKNQFKTTLQSLRKNCALTAKTNFGIKEKKLEKKEITIKTLNNKMSDDFSSSDSIYINNITKNDFEKRNIRITVPNKHLFPLEKPKEPTSYTLNFKAGDIDFLAEYKIGSLDGKSRSGILKLGDIIYRETLKIQEGTNLKITKLKVNTYHIDRLYDDRTS
ncbi:hypothetical protein SAMN05421766_104449 [Zobellia uliginosa]|uniref:GIY-YIG catalytic domain-containing protein n=1 Tax=Zobellia uliginosa TaxID=143224 RepID=A0ABY1KWF0_9FLAO|nr:hypothetical protein [Zobellia uliginosa]SIS86147.1 hypothetical protein SAMN05421766_104449 [Zobellia uliginosa]